MSQSVTSQRISLKILFRHFCFGFFFSFFFHSYRQRESRKNSSAGSSHPISPLAIGAEHLNTNTRAPSDWESARCWHSSVNLRAPHMETLSCSLKLFFNLCITWILKGQTAAAQTSLCCRQQRHLWVIPKSKAAIMQIFRQFARNYRWSGGELLPQQTERNVRVLGKEDGCGTSFRVTLANVVCQFFKGRKTQPVELIRKKVSGKKKLTSRQSSQFHRIQRPELRNIVKYIYFI